MKTVRILLGLLVVSVVIADAKKGDSSAFVRHDQLMETAQQQKNRSVKFMAKEAQSRAQLLGRQHDDWFAFKKDEARKFREASLGTEQEKEAFVEAATQKALALLKEHLEQWKRACDERREKGEQLYREHLEELSAFSSGIPSRSIPAIAMRYNRAKAG